MLSLRRISRFDSRGRRVLAAWLTVSMAFGAVSMPDVWAATCSVNVGTGADSGNCQSSACKTISYTMSQGACSVINIANGTYSAVSGETFPHVIGRNMELAGSGSDCSGPCTKVLIPAGTNGFEVDNTALSSATKIHDMELTVNASGSDTANGIVFNVGSVAMAPEIFNNTFDGVDPKIGDDAISIDDSSSDDGSFTGNIHDNVFMNWDEGIDVEQSSGGTGDNFSPTIANDTFTHNSYGYYDSIQTAAGGTNSPSITGNTFLANGVDLEDVVYPGDDFTHHATIENNSFGADPSDDSVSSPASSSAIYLDWYGYQREANHTQTFTADIRNNHIRAGKYDIVADLYPEQDASNTPLTVNLTIDGNTMDYAGSSGAYIDESEENVASAGLTTYNVNITNNRISNSNDSHAVKVSGTANHYYGPVSSHTTISGNTITQSGEDGILVSFSSISSLKSADYHVTVNNNTMTDAAPSRVSDTAIIMSFKPLGSASETLDFAINGNQMTNWDYGIYTDFVSLGAMGSVSGTISGNSITGSTASSSAASYGAMSLVFDSFSGVGGGTVKVNDNYIANNAVNGLDVHLRTTATNPLTFACNTIINNASDGVLLDEPGPVASGSPVSHAPASPFSTPDFGGGTNTSGTPSPGMNVFRNNNTGGGYYDFENEMPIADGSVAAHNDYWGTTNTSTIDSHIFDKLDNSSVGRVDYGTGTNNGNGPLSSAPTATYNAVISGPSTANAGDTVTYTAVITATGDCGQAAVIFKTGPPSQGTLVIGSATTTMGNVVSPLVPGDDMVIVNIGYLDPGGLSSPGARLRPLDGAASIQATVTWKVTMPNSGSVNQSGDVESEPGGSSDTNSITTTVGGQQIVDTPTLGQWGMIMFLLMLGMAGAFALRRRRFRGATLALLLSIGVAAVSSGAPGSKRQKGDEYHVGTLTSSSAQLLGHRPNGSSITGIRLVVSDGLNALVADNRYRVVDNRAGIGHQPARDGGVSRLSPGQAVLVDIERRKDGTVKRATIVVFDSLAQAQAKFVRKTSH